MNFGGGHGFGIRELGIFHHDAAEKGDKEDAESSADQHERDRFPVLVTG